MKAWKRCNGINFYAKFLRLKYFQRANNCYTDVEGKKRLDDSQTWSNYELAPWARRYTVQYTLCPWANAESSSYAWTIKRQSETWIIIKRLLCNTAAYYITFHLHLYMYIVLEFRFDTNFTLLPRCQRAFICEIQ